MYPTSCRAGIPAALAAAFVAVFLIGASPVQGYAGQAVAASAAPGDGANPELGPPLKTISFEVGCYVVPMDSMQNNITHAFGFSHAVLRNGTFLYRIIQPPENTIIKTNAYPAGENYTGGPIIIRASGNATVQMVKAKFPSLTLHIVTEPFVSGNVFVVKEATKIGLIWGKYGKTEQLLSDMLIPYDLLAINLIKINPSVINKYTLIIDDCWGMDLVPWDSNFDAICSTMQDFASKGNEIIFTCWAVSDYNYIFPGYSTGGRESKQTRQTNITAQPDFPAQYGGPKAISLAGVWTELKVVSPNVTVMAQGGEFADAFYFYYGKGIVEFFSFHPGEQNGSARDAAITMYGNKFIHMMPTDSGFTSSSSASPKTISMKGSATPSQEKSEIRIQLKPVGMTVTPANNLSVFYRLQEYISIESAFKSGSGAARTPAKNATNPDGTKSIRWDIPNLANNVTWDVVFNVSCSIAGADLPINLKNDSYINYIDDNEMPAMRPLMELKVTVMDGPVIHEPLVGLSIIAASVAVAAVWAGRQKKRA